MNTDYKFDFDWFSHHIPEWEVELAHFKGKDHLRFLEIGSFEGRSACWLLDNILTHGSCTLTCVDPHSDEWQCGPLDVSHAKEHFYHNIEPHKFRVHSIEQPSRDAARIVIGIKFDFVYVDGDHTAHVCLHDCVLAYELLAVGGIAIVDDYQESHPGVIKAFDAFESCHEGLIEVKTLTGQKLFRKIS